MTEQLPQHPSSPFGLFSVSQPGGAPCPCSAPPAAKSASGLPRKMSPAMWGMVLLLVVMVIFGMVLMARESQPLRGTTPLPAAQSPDLPSRAEPATYCVERVLRLPLSTPVALAVAADDRIILASEESLAVLSPEGALLGRLAVKEAPQAITVAPADHPLAGHLLVAGRNKVFVYTSELVLVNTWEIPGAAVHPVAIAAGSDGVYLLDALGKRVLRLDSTGKIVGEFAGADPRRQWPGIILPSMHGDLAVDAEGRIFVTNPGLRRVEVYGADGQLEVFWGREGAATDAFFGCCNPQSIALTPEGYVLTAEKGILRIKKYTPYGEFVELVAGPDQLGILEQARGGADTLADTLVLDIAPDSRGRIWVLPKGFPMLLVLSRHTSSPQGAGN